MKRFAALLALSLLATFPTLIAQAEENYIERSLVDPEMLVNVKGKMIFQDPAGTDRTTMTFTSLLGKSFEYASIIPGGADRKRGGGQYIQLPYASALGAENLSTFYLIAFDCNNYKTASWQSCLNSADNFSVVSRGKSLDYYKIYSNVPNSTYLQLGKLPLRSVQFSSDDFKKWTWFYRSENSTDYKFIVKEPKSPNDNPPTISQMKAAMVLATKGQVHISELDKIRCVRESKLRYICDYRVKAEMIFSDNPMDQLYSALTGIGVNKGRFWWQGGQWNFRIIPSN